MGSSFYGGGGQVSKKDFDALVEQVQKIDGTQAKHYSELAEEAARNAEADAERAEEVAQDMSELQARVGALEVVANDPIYSIADNKLQLYDILNDDIPYTIDNTKYVDATPSSSDSQAPIAYKFNSGYASYTSNYGFNISLNSSAHNNGSKYFIAALSGAQTNAHSTIQDFIVIEYRSSGEDFKLYSGNDDQVTLITSPVSPTGPIVNSFSLTSSSIVDSFFKVTKISASISCGNDYFRGMTGFYSIDWSTNPETLTSVAAAMATSDYTANAALEALNFSVAIPQKDMKQFYVADTIYNPVDAVARAQISQIPVVEANPVTTASATLTKVSIGDTVYELGGNKQFTLVGDDDLVYVLKVVGGVLTVGLKS